MKRKMITKRTRVRGADPEAVTNPTQLAGLPNTTSNHRLMALVRQAIGNLLDAR